MAALPGLALIQPNALFALVVLAVAWYVTARLRAGVTGHHPWARVARDLGIALVVLVAGVITAPRVSASIASTPGLPMGSHPALGCGDRDHRRRALRLFGLRV